MFSLAVVPRVSCRWFTSRTAICSVRPAAHFVKQTHSRPNPYNGIAIQPEYPERDPRRAGWNNKVGNHITDDTRSPEDKWRDNSLSTVPRLQRHRIADAYQGRSVKVKGGNFSEAVKELDKILARNRVRTTLFATARHEKKGVKRRRLQSDQWRKHFANQVRKNVQLVHKIRRRGV